jgi:hypothetical protein
MNTEKKQCKDCVAYRYNPNILGGVAECYNEIKPLNVFWPNEACQFFKPKEEVAKAS